MNHLRRLMILAGGTGGHVFPGIAVAHHVMEKGCQVRWLGTKDHIEADLVPHNGIEIDFIRISGLRGKALGKLIAAPIQISNACRQARAIIQRFQPNVVLGMGGYVSGPGALAAWSLGIPVILHEQNAIPGMANKWLAHIATKVLQGFPNAFPDAEVVGNPLRINLLSLPLPHQRLIGREGPIRVLVIGGSQGAKILNQIMPKVAEKLGNSIIIWHQSGKGVSQNIAQDYAAAVAKPQHKVIEFINDMATAYAWADLVVCRSGALTVSEIATVGLPAIFVPFQHKDRQQYWNARPLEKIGAAKILEQSEFTPNAVADTLSGWDRQVLLNMAKLARTTAILNATERVVNEVSQVAKT